jgi:hypothetical protein
VTRWKAAILAAIAHEEWLDTRREKDGPDADCRDCVLRPTCPFDDESPGDTCDVADVERQLVIKHGLLVFVDARRALADAVRYERKRKYPKHWSPRWLELVNRASQVLTERREWEAWVASAEAREAAKRRGVGVNHGESGDD